VVWHLSHILIFVASCRHPPQPPKPTPHPQTLALFVSSCVILATGTFFRIGYWSQKGLGKAKEEMWGWALDGVAGSASQRVLFESLVHLAFDTIYKSDVGFGNFPVVVIFVKGCLSFVLRPPLSIMIS